ncbi:MAG: hypothetical protein U0324_18615 [Polyangiales bacterium]
MNVKKRPLRPAVVSVAVLGVSLLASSPACADPPPRPAGCPATPPTQGSACAAPGLTCGYRACVDFWTVTATCDPATRRWGVTESTCNPPRIVPVTPPTANPPNVSPPPRPRRPRRPVIHRNPPGHPPPDPSRPDL